MPEDQRQPPADTLTTLRRGPVEIQGRMPWSSNRTFLVSVGGRDGPIGAVYKPLRGERPLWDFPGGLYRREAAAYELSEFLGWGLVPPTVVRDDAPHGRGSLQLLVDADYAEHYFTLLEEPGYHDQLRAVATLDVLLNNADRKSGHCLLGPGGRVWAIDNGLSFHVEPKLRTVIWDFAGEGVPDDLLDGVARLVGGAPPQLARLLAPEEAEALCGRARALCAHPVLPAPDPDRRPYPWPLV